MKKEVLGVSVVVCCHNSTSRLPQTLYHLALQQTGDQIPWEVVVVDNASEDDTADVARGLWPKAASVPLRVVYEPQIGLAHARAKGFEEAKYGIVSFIDDDNWVAVNWVTQVAGLMTKHSEIGACGGHSEAVFETTPPSWFQKYASSYAVGPDGLERGDITAKRGWLWGAGMTIRKKAWEQLIRNGFRSRLTGRVGKKLLAGEDSEICFALRLAGWAVWYEPQLRLRHYIPAARMSWKVLRSMHRSFGASGVIFDPYLEVFKNGPKAAPKSWKKEVLRTSWKMLAYSRNWAKFVSSGGLGIREILAMEEIIGRITELVRTRNFYKQSFYMIRDLQRMCGGR